MKHSLIGMAAALVMPTLVSGQGKLVTAPSSRATTQVVIAAASAEGGPAPAPMFIKIDYGQPHARGRQVAGALPDDIGKVWRLGANAPTTLTTDTDLVLGGARVPRGTYRLYAETTLGVWKLVVNKSVQGDPLAPDRAADVASVPLKARTLATPLESLTMWLIPAPAGALNGELRIAWGTLEHTVDWSVKQ